MSEYQFYRRGIASLRGQRGSTPIAPQFEKEFFIRKEEITPAKLVILSQSLHVMLVRYVHAIFIPKYKDKTLAKMKVTCKSFETQEENPELCEICNEMQFIEHIKRYLVMDVCVVDLRVSKMDDGTMWSHTIKDWPLRKDQAELLEKKVLSKSPDGRCYGMEFEISRSGSNSPGTGNDFQFNGWHDMRGFMMSSRRTSLQIEKALKVGRQITREQAAQEYFKVPNYEELFSPTQNKVRFFLNYLKRIYGESRLSVGMDGHSATRRAEESWDAPAPMGGDPQETGPPVESSWENPTPLGIVDELPTIDQPESVAPPAASWESPAPRANAVPSQMLSKVDGEIRELAGVSKKEDNKVFKKEELSIEPPKSEGIESPFEAAVNKYPPTDDGFVQEEPISEGEKRITPESFDEV